MDIFKGKGTELVFDIMKLDKMHTLGEILYTLMERPIFHQNFKCDYLNMVYK